MLASARHAPPRVDTLQPWIDSVGVAGTVPALEQLRRNRAIWDGPERSLARGWWELRRGVVTANGLTVEAGVRVLVAERSARRDSPLPTYLLARGFYDLSVARAPVRSNNAQQDGEANVETFWRLLRDLLATHQSFSSADQFATRALLALGDRTLRHDEAASLRMLRARDPANAALMIVDARRLRTEGAMRQALALFDSAHIRGGDRGVLGVERARTLTALGNAAAGVEAYWSGTEALTPAGREAYRTDLAWFVHPDTLAPFDAVPTDSVQAWLQRFWLERDAIAANTPGERLEEQLLRWVDAFRDYRVPLAWRRTQYSRVEFLFEELDLCLNDTGRRLQEELARLQPSLQGDPRGDEPLLDHRGLMVLRHGEPVRRVVGKPAADADTMAQVLAWGQGERKPLALRALRMSESMRFNESWLYWLDGRWRTLSFRGSEALGTHAATTLMSYLPLADALGRRFRLDWELRNTLSDEWAKAEAWLRERSRQDFRSLACDAPVRTLVHHQREDAVLAAAVDSDTPPIRDPWPSAIQVYALGADAASGRAVVALAIPGDRLSSSRLPDGRLEHLVQIRVTAFERASGRFVERDSVARFVTRDALREGSFVNQLLEFPLGPGSWTVAVKLMQESDTAGSYALLPAATVGSPGRLSMSDIVLGRQGGAPWQTPGGTGFPINTLGTWPRTADAAIYYEVYNAAAGETLRTRIEIRPLDGRTTRGRVSATFTEVAPAGVLRVERRLGLDQLEGGTYQLEIVVEAPQGTVRRQQRLIVTPGGAGAR
jgi:hypothetical protein